MENIRERAISEITGIIVDKVSQERINHRKGTRNNILNIFVKDPNARKGFDLATEQMRYLPKRYFAPIDGDEKGWNIVNVTAFPTRDEAESATQVLKRR